MDRFQESRVDTIVAVEAIPYTLTGKKMEIPVRRLLGGRRRDGSRFPNFPKNFSSSLCVN